jgi:hypothetical protein
MIRTNAATTLRSLIATPRTSTATPPPSNPSPTPASATLANARLSFGASSVLKQRAMPEEDEKMRKGDPLQVRSGRLGDDRMVPEEDEKMRKGDPLQTRSGRLGDDRMVPEEDEKMRKGDPQAKLNRVGYQPPWLTQMILNRSIR